MSVGVNTGSSQSWICGVQGSDQGQVYKDCLNCPMLEPTLVGAEENLWFLDALKSIISKLILPEKT